MKKNKRQNPVPHTQCWSLSRSQGLTWDWTRRSLLRDPGRQEITLNWTIETSVKKMDLKDLLVKMYSMPQRIPIILPSPRWGSIAWKYAK